MCVAIDKAVAALAGDIDGDWSYVGLYQDTKIKGTWRENSPLYADMDDD